MSELQQGNLDGVLLAARGVTRSFRVGANELHVLRGVDLSLREGEFVAIRGSSGSGKSTLLHILGLLDRPNDGSLFYRGVDLARASERRRTKLRSTEFAFVFQFYYLLPELSAVENVLMPAMIAGSAAASIPASRSGRRKRAEELLDRVGLNDRGKHRPHQLSGGERQRVAFARALMNQPKLVFCDEPTGNLDSKTSEGIHRLMRELNESLGQAFLVVTHESAMAAAASRQLVMVDGVITEEGRAAAAPVPEAR